MKLSIFGGRIPSGYDSDDAHLLDLADTSHADHLITGDHRSGLLLEQRIGRASILTAKVFVEQLGI